MSDDNILDNPPCVTWMLTRRRFLKGMAVSAAIAPLVQACEFGEVFDDDIQTSVDFDLSGADTAKLSEIGGLGCVSAGAIDILLIRDAQDSILAFDRYCTHQNLDMSECDNNALPGQWDQTTRQLTCRWHTSVFDEDGKVVSGPAPSPIRRYRVEFDAAAGTGTVFLVGSAANAQEMA